MGLTKVTKLVVLHLKQQFINFLQVDLTTFYHFQTQNFYFCSFIQCLKGNG